MDDLRYGDILHTWQDASESPLRASFIDAIPTASDHPTETTTGRVATTGNAAETHCIGTFGVSTMARSQTDGMFTTATKTPATTIRRTWNACRNWIITMIGTARSLVNGWSNRADILTPFENWQRLGIVQTPGEHGTVSMPGLSGRTDNRAQASAISADGHIRHSNPAKTDSAPTPASQHGGASRGQMTLSERAWDADRPLGLTAIAGPSTAPVRVLGLSEDGTSPVYNLTVGGPPEYFANGVLVHNCADAIRYGLMHAHWLDQKTKRTTRRMVAR